MTSSEAGETRSRILECARDLYLARGMAGLSMRAVADCAGISATAIYRHFDNKEALVSAVSARGFELFAGYLWSALDAANPVERLDSAAMKYLEFALENRGYYRVMFMSTAEDFGWKSLPDANQSRLAPTFQFLVDRVRECIECGAFRARDPVELSAVIWAHVHGLVSLYIAGSLRPVVADDAAFSAFFASSRSVLHQGLSA